jgi:dihydromethanopterin reductase (acceptor)
MKIIWCVTGASHLLPETVATLEKTTKKNSITLLLSKAGAEVSKTYKLYDRMIKTADKHVLETEHGASTPICMKLSQYDLTVIAPCTANTTAKIAHGIADSLASNIAAQSLKTGKPLIILPTDTKEKLKTTTLSGGEIEIKCRKTDLENIKKLRDEGITIAETTSQLQKCLTTQGCL